MSDFKAETVKRYELPRAPEWHAPAPAPSTVFSRAEDVSLRLAGATSNLIGAVDRLLGSGPVFGDQMLRNDVGPGGLLPALDQTLADMQKSIDRVEALTARLREATGNV